MADNRQKPVGPRPTGTGAVVTKPAPKPAAVAAEERDATETGLRPSDPKNDGPAPVPKEKEKPAPVQTAAEDEDEPEEDEENDGFIPFEDAGDYYVIRIPKEPKGSVSKTGESYLLATTRGNRPTGGTYRKAPIMMSVNIYAKKLNGK